MSDLNKKLDLVCLGEPMLEFNQQKDGSFVQGHGGDTANCAVSAARQGARVGYITSLGDDQFGRSFLDLWQRENIDCSNVTINPDAATGIYFVTHDDSGHHYTYYRKRSAAAQIQPENLSADLIASARYLHVSAISQAISDSAAETVFEAIRLANDNQTRVAYDTNLRLNLWGAEKARSVIHEAMRSCQIALPSYEDAVVLTEQTDPDAIVDFYLELGAEVVVLKLGAEGAIVASVNEREKVEGLPAKTIDTNAAGDTFAGALLAELANNVDTVKAAQYANKIAAKSTEAHGAVTSIPYRI